MTKSLRLSRIFRKDTGNTLILPVDHGIGGNMKGLEKPMKVLKDLTIPEVDAVLLNDGLVKKSEDVFHGKNAPARLLNADIFSYESSSEKVEHHITFSPDTAVRKGYDCMKLVIFWDRPDEERMRSIKLISSVIEEAERWDMPVLVEPLLSKHYDDKEERTELLTSANRVAFELGADILKANHPGDLDVLESWVKDYDIPIILLGGDKEGTTNDLVEIVGESIEVGAKGVAMGRNVWQRSTKEAQSLLKKFSSVIHKNT